MLKNAESALDDEVLELQAEFLNKKKAYIDLKSSAANELIQKIKDLKAKLQKLRKKCENSTLRKILYYLRIKNLERRIPKLEGNFKNTIIKRTRNAKEAALAVKGKLVNIKKNKERIISERCLQPIRELEFTKEVIDGLYTLIAGAIGENSVVKELEKLPDDNFLINDFSIKFKTPIINRKENDRIFSIQIDHLLICKSGVYILETKNWSKKSIQNLDLRSPVKQILRTSYALFVLLNGRNNHGNIRLNPHHWGDKKIPIRNLIVMINGKPKEEFKHVKVLSLNQLNGYLSYFDPVFNEAEVKSIYGFLRRKTH